MMMMIDTKKQQPGIGLQGSHNNSSFVGKKVLPNTYKNPKKLYVSPYS
jgi:hypothetical protein